MVKRLLLSLLLFVMATKPIYTDKNEFISSQTKVLGVQWNGNELIVDVSKDIASYGGGNAMEYEVVSQILGCVFANPEVEVFTLLIEGKEGYLPEGTQILKYSRDDYENNYFSNTK
ncbi:MAG TPA: hypothetical protein GX707_10780 [Epulopiscium sp.]|nr:hypothetical protein [Candidatus Epulonipiscium sp.]